MYEELPALPRVKREGTTVRYYRKKCHYFKFEGTVVRYFAV
ncbi:hypothetical protein GCM10008018_48940 [Paenibacillus marchantiophytorum]|uniref:Uncharacterized protein n=1 Tax=Paenibacillus marchantiophytorum TaxID=1619310 RepID=A0ABQ1F1W6_9BACL|nr:hypothetical protein GCM10008018_48940 [Paenibacillus marchantiophytorum]